MTYIRIVAVTGSVLVLAACDPVEGFDGISAGSVPDSELVTLNMDGTLPDQNFSGIGVSGSGESFAGSGSTLSGYSFAYGRVTGTNTFLGVAGFAPTSVPGAEVDTGTVGYTGTYQLAYIGNTEQTQSGDITLTATFTGRTFTGEADGLIVNGTYGGAGGTELGGEVSFGGVTATLDGVVGQDRVVGAFAGNTTGAVLVGGILAEADE
ncbi:hypothetical protein [Yoonia sp. SDW83-1]|uniref:hypothetical protein n=1 Tax=Yoonia sp. SDW83-1 TaxID=3366945 RepID=UPI00398C41CF